MPRTEFLHLRMISINKEFTSKSASYKSVNFPINIKKTSKNIYIQILTSAAISLMNWRNAIQKTIIV